MKHNSVCKFKSSRSFLLILALATIMFNGGVVAAEESVNQSKSKLDAQPSAQTENSAASEKTQATPNGGLLQDFDSLGGNDVLLQRARALNPDSEIRIVQDRIVNRRLRFEFAPELSTVLGGDSYNTTQFLGLATHFHITPQWSVGLKYNYAFNRLKPEGEYLISDTSIEGKARIPDIDWPKSEVQLFGSWYPIYGKMNLYDLGVLHFDLYGTAGVGQVELKSGNSRSVTAGLGLGLWMSQHLTTRFEFKWENYTAKRFNGDAQMNTTVGTIEVGYLL